MDNLKKKHTFFSCQLGSSYRLLGIGFTTLALAMSTGQAFAQDQKKGNDANITAQASANEKKVVYRGVVFDENRTPLFGVNVFVKGQKGTGTVTDMNGEYNLPLPQGKYTLVFSYMGMKTLEVRIESNSKLTVRMQPDSEVLKETVVTGIYRRKSESFTGSASTYKADELKEIGNSNILQSLSALDPSFVIMDNNLMGSDPNAKMNVNINGTTSIQGLSDTYDSNPNQPLFILDGFETTLERISYLSMDRVESITILKDAASTAIYGSKSANGVIVVETKKPEAGRLRFTYNGNFEFGWADLSDYNLMNSREKLEFEKLSGYYGKLDENGEILSDPSRRLYYERLGNVVKGLDTYWMNEPLRNAFTQDHSISAEGGDSAFRYGLTFRYRKTEGVMKGSGRDNVDGSLNLSYRINKFNFSNLTNVYYTETENNKVPFSDFAQANPFFSKWDENGDVYKVLDKEEGVGGQNTYYFNPLWDMQQNSFDKSDDLTFNNNLNVEYRPIDQIRLVAKFGLTTERGKSENFQSPYSTRFIETEELKRGSFTQNNQNRTSYDGSFIASYGDVFGAHTVNVIAGAQMSENNLKSAAFTAIGYTSDQFSNPNFALGYPEGGKPRSSVTKSRSCSFYMNANYAYDMRYLLDFNLRSDGASVFGVNNPFSTTWSLGLAWNIHNEKFFKKSDIVNTLKLRYSIGNPGNQNINAKIANNVYTYYTQYPNMFGLAALVSKWGNKDLKWQRTTTHNFGINAEFFKSRLRLSADYTLRNSDPTLMIIEQPSSTGTTSVPKNIGATKNKSFSLMASYDIIRNKNLKWTVNANMLNTKTKYDKIGDTLQKLNQEGRANQTLYRYYDGASSTAIWAVRSMGIDPMTGNELFVRKNGDYTFKWDSSEEVVCGDTTPDMEGNMGTTLRYKGFSLSMNFRYRWGGQAQLSTLLNKVENISDEAIKYNQDRRALHDRWQKPGDIAKFKRIDDTSITNLSSRFIADDNTFECKSISLGYESSTAPWLKKCGLSSANFRVYMNDIFRISTIKQERGIDYPFQRAIAASVGLRF